MSFFWMCAPAYNNPGSAVRDNILWSFVLNSRSTQKVNLYLFFAPACVCVCVHVEPYSCDTECYFMQTLDSVFSSSLRICIYCERLHVYIYDVDFHKNQSGNGKKICMCRMIQIRSLANRSRTRRGVPFRPKWWHKKNPLCQWRRSKYKFFRCRYFAQMKTRKSAVNAVEWPNTW